MSIYDVDFNKMGRLLLPPDKRGVYTKALVKSLLSPMQWLRDLWLGSYRIGSSAAPYIATTVYIKGDRVVYKYAVYESLLSGTLNIDPLDTAHWVKVQDNFIGVEERIKYNGSVIMLTWALNKYFGTVFRQPNNVSDIYLQMHNKPTSVFVVGADEVDSSVVYANTSSEFVVNAYSFGSYANMTIWFPVAVYDALDSDPANRDKIVRNFADLYVVAGIIYNINTY